MIRGTSSVRRNGSQRPTATGVNLRISRRPMRHTGPLPWDVWELARPAPGGESHTVASLWVE